MVITLYTYLGLAFVVLGVALQLLCLVASDRSYNRILLALDAVRDTPMKMSLW